MARRKVVIILAISFVGALAPIAGFFLTILVVEHLRFRDADPAMRPLVPLGAMILSNPIAFHRHCCYIVTFSPESRLSDANVAELACLNKLPEKNHLTVAIETPSVTDASIPTLKALHRVDILEVVKTSITDNGIEELRRSLPSSTRVQTREKPANGPQPQRPPPAEHPR